MKCRFCGRTYAGVTSVNRRGDHISEASYYRCRARTSLSPVRCTNRTLRADYLDHVVWEQIEALLANPDIVMAEVERRQERAGDTGVLERNLDRVRTQLASREKQKARSWKAFELTGDEDTFKQSIGHLQKETEALQREESRLQQEIEANTQFRPDPLDINKACELVRQNLKGLSLEDKRQALEALDVRVWMDGDKVEIEGAVPIPEVSIASTSPTRRWGPILPL